MTIADKVKSRRYASLGRALSAINRSALGKPEKKVLLQLARDVYSQPLPVDKIPKSDRIEETASFGGVGLELHGDILRLSLWTMGTMAKHGLTREQVFDRVKDTLIGAMEFKGG